MEEMGSMNNILGTTIKEYTLSRTEKKSSKAVLLLHDKMRL